MRRSYLSIMTIFQGLAAVEHDRRGEVLIIPGRNVAFTRLALEMPWARKAARLALGGKASAAAVEREAVAYAYSSVGPLRLQEGGAK